MPLATPKSSFDSPSQTRKHCEDGAFAASFFVSSNHETSVKEHRRFFGGGYRRISQRSRGIATFWPHLYSDTPRKGRRRAACCRLLLRTRRGLSVVFFSGLRPSARSAPSAALAVDYGPFWVPTLVPTVPISPDRDLSEPLRSPLLGFPTPSGIPRPLRTVWTPSALLTSFN